jgi:apolipoprotein N-acyltransferase
VRRWTPERVVACLGLAIALLWLLYVTGNASWQAPRFHELLIGLGAPLPASTELFFASYKWWWLAPIVFALLAADVVRRPRPSALRVIVVFLAGAMCGLALHVWMSSALRQPLADILEAIG